MQVDVYTYEDYNYLTFQDACEGGRSWVRKLLKKGRAKTQRGAHKLKVLNEMCGGNQTLKTLQSTVSGSSSPVYTAPEEHLNTIVTAESLLGLYLDTKKSPELKEEGQGGKDSKGLKQISKEDSAKCDVYSLSCVLLELFSGTRERLRERLPEDLCRYYTHRMRAYQRNPTTSKPASVDMRCKRSVSSPRRSSGGQRDSSLSSRNRSLISTRGRIPEFIDGDPIGGVGINLEGLNVPDLLLKPIKCGLALDKNNRVSMAVLRDLLSRALKSTAGRDVEGKHKIQYLDKDRVAEVDKQLVIANLIKGTTNVYKLDNLFGVRVAVKVMGSLALSGALETEVQILQESCQHPFVVGFFGCGFSERSGWFLAMEYVPNTLADVCFGSPVPVQQRLQMAVDMAKGFSYLHAKGVSLCYVAVHVA